MMGIRACYYGRRMNRAKFVDVNILGAGGGDGVPFCTLSHSRKISSPPLTLPLFRLTRQILSSAVFGAPNDVHKEL